MSYSELGDSITAGVTVRASDLVKLVNQIFVDKMEFVHLAVTVDLADEDDAGTVNLYAVPDARSDEVKEYTPISGKLYPDLSELID